MKTKSLLLTLGLLLTLNALSQTRVDTLIHKRNPDFISGKVPTYYTPGYKEYASDLQAIITKAIDFFEEKYSKEFNVKLVVFNEEQWLNEINPYGYVFYISGWIVMNTGMDYDAFKTLYGADNYARQLDVELEEKGISADEMIRSIFKFCAVHELGHFFIRNLSATRAPDRWTNEIIASYLAYDFYEDSNPEMILGWDIFCTVNKNNYSPDYSTVSDFNRLYSRVGLHNYLWYTTCISLLSKSLLTCKETDLVKHYEKYFPRESETTFSLEETIRIIDIVCPGTVKSWVAEMESRTQK